MLTYSKALELKNAGFPQIAKNYSGLAYKDETHFGTVLGFVPIDDENVYIPTLSELIEQCRKKCGNFALFDHGDSIVCGDYMPYEHDWIIRSEGSSLKEAVANLYIALNK